MGLDIKIVVERRASDGSWSLVERPGPVSDEGHPPEWEIWRNDFCFNMMVGRQVRSNDINPEVFIASERGLPADLSTSARQALDAQQGVLPGQTSYLDDAVAASWLDLADFDDFNWDTPLMRKLIAHAPSGVFQITEAMHRELQLHVEEHGWPPEGWTLGSGAGVSVTLSVPTTPRSWSEQLYGIIEDMRNVGSQQPHDVRCVFVIDY